MVDTITGKPVQYVYFSIPAIIISVVKLIMLNSCSDCVRGWVCCNVCGHSYYLGLVQYDDENG